MPTLESFNVKNKDELKNKKFGELGMDIDSLRDSARETIQSVEKEIVDLKKQKEQEPNIDIHALKRGLEGPFSEYEPVNALTQLVFKLKEKLSRYDTIISDDASGRLVSLVLNKVINNKREALKKSRTKLNFVAAGRHDNERIEEAIRKFIDEKKEFGKTLLVTEHIATGWSIGKLIKILEDRRVDFDIATVSVARHLAGSGYEKNLLKRIYYGEVGDSGLLFYNRSEYSGVKKDNIGSTAFPVLSKYHIKHDRPKINRARKDAKKLGDRLSELIE